MKKTKFDKLTDEQFKDLVNSSPTWASLQKQLDYKASIPTRVKLKVIERCTLLGITPKFSLASQKRQVNCIVCGKPLIGNQIKFCSEECKCKWYYENHKEDQYQYAVQKNDKRLNTKLKLVLYKGGKCEKCGYNRNLAALQFHHILPNTKKFGLNGRNILSSSEQELLEEVNKCVLLCANCHAEEHYPQRDMNLLVSENFEN